MSKYPIGNKLKDLTQSVILNIIMRLCFVLAFAALVTGSAYGVVEEDVPQEEAVKAKKEMNTNETVSDDLIICWLSEITHFTRKDNFIDVSLDRQPYIEDCYVQAPNSKIVEASLFKMGGVTVHHRSKYVSCRITIGPMRDDLVGEWNLCGKHEDDSEMRCQTVTITLGSSNWNFINETSFAHPVHLGGSVNSGVLGTGALSTCHVVTPTGEDLVMKNDVQYPHIERNDPLLCSVLIKDITEDMMGDWVIYGRFRPALGQTEIRLPLTFSLYNEDNPYDQAYNITVLESQMYLVNMGTNLTVDVSQRTGIVEHCIYTSPTGKTFNINDIDVPEEVTISSSDTVCQITISPITEEALGEWQIIGKFRNGLLFDERRRIFNIIKEDPENPIPESVARTVENMPQKNIITSINKTHTIAIYSEEFVEHESCHLITPDGLQYAFIPGFNVPDVEIVHQTGVDCGIMLILKRESMIGDWALLARATRLSIPIERRLGINIRVEDNFVIQSDIFIKEGADLYLHLNGASSVQPQSCVLYGPYGTEYTNAEIDPVYNRAKCGYIVRNVDQNHNGTWVIEYGDKIKRRGSVGVHVLDLEELSLDNMHWTVGSSINISVGPEHAVYCIISDALLNVIFDNFGKCKIALDRVTIDHQGYWTVMVGLPGAVRLRRFGFYVEVHNTGSMPLVTTSLEVRNSSVMLTCSVPIAHEVHACKFRDPSNNILVAAHGVGQDGYMFHGSIVDYESSSHSHDCTLQILNPSVIDLGIWRCALDTSTGTYYGFLTVLMPELVQDSSITAPVIIEPVLTASSPTTLEGEPVTLSCSISSALRYCYFRAGNGTVYNVYPRMYREENFEYVGAGLDAGECGIQFKRFAVRDAKGWSCHVGLANTTAKELRTAVFADVIAKMEVRHYWRYSSMVVVEARVYNEHALDYCRFVRLDGLGFTSDNLPPGYEIEESLYRGFCILYINNPNIFDLQPWTIAAKLKGGDGEISRTTNGNLIVDLQNHNIIGKILFWLLIITLCLIPVMMASALIPKTNRDWTYGRASRLRASFRSSWNHTFAKKPLVNI